MSKTGYASGDANYYTAEGRWYVDLASRPMTNMPSGTYAWGTLSVLTMRHAFGDTGFCGVQLFAAGGHLYFREAMDGNWSSWKEL